MDRIFCMQVFVSVVEHASFTRAADVLGISRSGVTGAIVKLEKQLGVRLLNRTTRKLSVTDEGQAYYAHCVRILGEIAEVEDGLSDARQQPQGRLRVSIPHSFVDAFFVGLQDFAQRYPRLSIEILVADRAVNFVDEGVDCAIRAVGIPADSGLVAHELSVMHWLTCASPDYLSRCGVPAAPAQLGGHLCVPFSSPTTRRVRNWSFAVDGEIVSVVPHGNIALTSFDAAARFAMTGAGIVQLPDAIAARFVKGGALAPVLTPYIAAAPPLTLVYPANRFLSARVRVFRDFFAGVFPADGWLAEVVDNRDASSGCSLPGQS